MFKCTVVSLDYFGKAPYVFRSRMPIKASAEMIFSCFEDENSWSDWALPIRGVTWTSEKPFATGTTRRVKMMGSWIVNESFIAWNYPKRMAFCFTDSSFGLVESFAEDYQLIESEEGCTEVEWTMAMTPRGIGKVTLYLLRPFMQMGLSWMLKRFRRHVEKVAANPNGV